MLGTHSQERVLACKYTHTHKHTPPHRVSVNGRSRPLCLLLVTQWRCCSIATTTPQAGFHPRVASTSGGEEGRWVGTGRVVRSGWRSSAWPAAGRGGAAAGLGAPGKEGRSLHASPHQRSAPVSGVQFFGVAGWGWANLGARSWQWRASPEQQEPKESGRSSSRENPGGKDQE